MAKVSCTFCNKHVTVCPYRAVACLKVKKRSVFCGLIAIQEFFSLKMWCLIVFFTEIACKHVKRYSGYWMEHSSVFTLLPPRFFPFFLFSSQQTAGHIHLDWPAALHIGFLMFLANSLGCASKGMIYALKWMNEKPYLPCFQIWSPQTCDWRVCCILSAFFYLNHNNSHNDYCNYTVTATLDSFDDIVKQW